MNPTLLILAAGMGSRYSGLKQIDPIGPNDEFLLDYAVYDAIRAGFGKVVFVITKGMEREFKEKVSSRYTSHILVDYAYQELDAVPMGCSVPDSRLKPWGTGHAVLVAREIIKEPFAVINADDFYGLESYKILSSALKEITSDSKELLMVGFHVENALSRHGKVSRGVCTLDGEHLVSVIEREEIENNNGAIVFTDKNNESGTLPADTLVSMNLWGFAPDTIFPILEQQFAEFVATQVSLAGAEFYLPAAVNYAIKTGMVSVKVLETSEAWFGLTYPEDKIVVQENILKMIRQGIYPRRLF